MTEIDAATAGIPEARRSRPTPRSRFVAVDGMPNLRDVGGYPVIGGGMTRWGVLFRGGALGELTPAAHDQLAALGLRTIVDLREDEEVADKPSAALPAGIFPHFNPIFRDRIVLPDVHDLEPMYAQILEVCAAEIVAVVQLLAAPGALPGLVHCSAGKDRTGLVIGVLLSALGVPDNVVADDYARTGETLTGSYRDRITAKAIALGLNAERAEVLMGSPPEVMRAILATVRRRHGSAEDYLFAHGCAAEALTALWTQLVDVRAGD